MLHLLLPQETDLTFLTKVKEVLEEKLNSEWAEMGQWLIMTILVIGTLVRILCSCCSGCKQDQCNQCKQWSNQEEMMPLRQLEQLTDASAPPLYPRFGGK